MATRCPNMAIFGFQTERQAAIRNSKNRNPPRAVSMLPITLVNEIDQMIREGTLSHRKIAAHLGVSRGVVNAIARGKRGLYGHDPLETSPLTPTSPPTRCPDCGYRVYLPCLICRTRDHHRRQIMLRILARTKRTDNRVRRKRAG
jgi:hypothetical protein